MTHIPDACTRDAAVRAYVWRFGEGPPVYQFLGKPKKLARELQAAVQRGEPVTAEYLYRALDMWPPPPPDTLI
jgi:hypothetical protein